MTKKADYGEVARNYYVCDLLSFQKITELLPVSDKALRMWAEAEDWSGQRKKYLESRQSFHEELYEFARTIMRSLKEDIENGNKLDAGRLYFLRGILPQITKVKDYENVVNTKEELQQSGLKDETLSLIEKTILGL